MQKVKWRWPLTPMRCSFDPSVQLNYMEFSHRIHRPMLPDFGRSGTRHRRQQQNALYAAVKLWVFVIYIKDALCEKVRSCAMMVNFDQQLFSITWQNRPLMLRLASPPPYSIWDFRSACVYPVCCFLTAPYCEWSWPLTSIVCRGIYGKYMRH